MKRGAIVVAVVALLGSACASAPEPSARVVRSGFSIRDDRIGFGAVVRVEGDRTLHDIDLRVTFRAGKTTLGDERDTLPYCPPATDCPYGQMIFGAELGDEWRDVDSVSLDVVSTGAVRDGPTAVDTLKTYVHNQAVNVEPDGRAGTAYTIAYRGVRPLAGYSFFTEQGDRNKLRYEATILPRAGGDRFETAFYPGSVPVRGD